MEILHCKDLGATESVVTNAVVLVLGECQIPIATYLRVGGGGIYPHIKLYFNMFNVLRIDNAMFIVIADGQTETHTDSLNTIVSQPLRGSTNN